MAPYDGYEDDEMPMEDVPQVYPGKVMSAAQQAAEYEKELDVPGGVTRDPRETMKGGVVQAVVDSIRNMFGAPPPLQGYDPWKSRSVLASQDKLNKATARKDEAQGKRKSQQKVNLKQTFKHPKKEKK